MLLLFFFGVFFFVFFFKLNIKFYHFYSNILKQNERRPHYTHTRRHTQKITEKMGKNNKQGIVPQHSKNKLTLHHFHWQTLQTHPHLACPSHHEVNAPPLYIYFFWVFKNCWHQPPTITIPKYIHPFPFFSIPNFIS